MLNTAEGVAVSIQLKFSEIGWNKMPSVACDKVFVKADPDDLEWKSMIHASGEDSLRIEQAAAEKFFPSLMNAGYHDELALWLAYSRIVGMKCPGRHSLFGGFSWRAENLIAGAKTSSSCRYQTVRSEERFRLLYLEVQGDSGSGILRVFERPKPVEQPQCTLISKHIPDDYFRGHHALVIGGSRGIGEVCAKTFAMGGGKVTLTYALGRSDALRVVEEIRASGKDANCEPLDVTNIFLSNGEPNFKVEGVTHLIYTASPQILPHRSNRLNVSLLNEYYQFYVAGLLRMIDRLASSRSLIGVFAPSSIFVEPLNETFYEYALAKKMMESALEVVRERMPELKIMMPRLPSLQTDQTVTIYAKKNSESSRTASEATLQILLPFLLSLK